MGDYDVTAGGSGKVVYGPPPPPPKEEDKKVGTEPKPTAPASPPPNGEVLKKITTEVKSLGLKIPKDFLDEKGNIREDKAAEAKKFIAEEAAKRKGKDLGAAARLYQKALSLDPQDKTLRLETAKTWKAWADTQTKPDVKLTTLKTALDTLKPGGDADQTALFLDYSKEFATLALTAKKGPEARHAIAQAAKFANEQQLDGLHEFLAKPEHSALLQENEHPWMFLGDALAAEGKFGEACFAYNRGVNAAHKDKNFPLRDDFNQKWKLAHEGKYPPQLDFVDPLSGQVANPVAAGLYKALKAQGFAAADMDKPVDGKDADNKISAQEVYKFISDNINDPKIQEILTQSGISLTDQEKKDAKTLGLGLFLADKYTKEAERLKKEDATGSVDTRAKLLTFATSLDPDNPKRAEALGDFFAEQKAYPLAMQAYAESLNAAKAMPRPDKNPRAAEGHDQWLKDTETRLKGKIDENFDAGIKAAQKSASEIFQKAQKEGANPQIAKDQLQVLLGAQSMYDLYAQTFPDEMKSPKRLQEQGALYDVIGQALQAAGKKGEAKTFYAKAIEQYQAGINANKNDAAYCIGAYKRMGAAHDALGNYKEALISYSKAAMCEKLRINYNPKLGGQVPKLSDVKHDHAPNVPYGVWDIRQGNYIHSDVHDINRIDGIDTLPEWASGPRDNYIATLKARIDGGAAHRAELRGKTPPDNEAIYESLNEEAKLLSFFDRGEEATKIGAEAKELKATIDNQNLGKEVEVLNQTGLLDAKSLDAVSEKENKGQANPLKFGDYVKFEKGPDGKSKVSFTPAYESLDTESKNRVMKALVNAGQRAQISQNVDKAQGPAKLFYEGQLAIFDDNRELAKTKLEAFAKEAKDTKDPKLAMMLKQADGAIAILGQDGKQKPEDVLKDLRTMLAPLAMTLKPGQDGGIDLGAISKDEVKTFEDFKKYLADQVSVDGVSFNAVLFASYEKVMTDPKHEALLKQLYKQFNSSADAPQMSVAEMQSALRSFQKDIIDVSAGRFVGNHLGNAKGRDQLRTLLQDPTLDKSIKAKLCEEVIEMGEGKGYTPPHISALFQSKVNGHGFYFQDDKLSLGVSYAMKVLNLGDQADVASSKQIEKYSLYPHEIQRLSANELNHTVTPELIKETAKLVKDLSGKSDGASLMRAKLATMYLAVVDNENWTFDKATDRFKDRVTDKQRAEMANALKALLEQSSNIKTNEDFSKWNNQVRRFIRGQGAGKEDDIAGTAREYLGKGAGDLTGDVAEKFNWVVSKTPEDAFNGMIPAVSGSYNDLLRFVDEVHVSELHGVPVEVFPSSVAVTDPAQREKAENLIFELQGMKRGFWYNYQQRNMLSRNLSETASIAGMGDIASINNANKEIDAIIEDVKKAKTNEDFEAIKARITRATKAGGAIHEGFKESEMDGTEQMINLVQTIAEIVVITYVTQGIGTEAALGRATVALGQTAARTRNLRMAYQAFQEVRTVANAARAAELMEVASVARYGSMAGELRTVAAGTAEIAEAQKMFSGGVRLAQALGGEAGWGAKAVTGFKMGAQISLTENVVASLSGQLKTEPTTILDWLKDATATGFSMVVSAGLNPTFGKSVEESVVKSLFQRYVANGAKGALHFLGDTGLEVIEEVVDNYVRKKLDGDYSKLSWDELRDITMVCFAGGAKQGITSHLASFTKGKIVDIQAKRYQEGFEARGERVVQDPKLGYVLVDSDGGFIRKTDELGLQSFLAFEADNNSHAPRGIELISFDSTEKGAKGYAHVSDSEIFPVVESDKVKSADEIKADAAKAQADAKQKSAEKVKVDKERKLYAEFLNKGSQVQEVKRNDGVVIGLAVVDSNGVKLRDATKDEIETFQNYQKLTEGFSTRGEKVVGSPSKGYQLVDANGQTLRQATAPELTLYLNHKKKTTAEAKVKADAISKAQVDGDKKAEAELNAQGKSKTAQAEKLNQAIEKGATIHKITRGEGNKEVVMGFMVKGVEGDFEGLFLKDQAGSLWATEAQFKAFEKHQSEAKQKADEAAKAEAKTKSIADAKALKESKEKQKTEWRGAFEKGVKVEPVYRKGHILLGYEVKGVTAETAGLFHKDADGVYWATKDQFAAYQKYRVDMNAKETTKAKVIELGARIDAKKTAAGGKENPEIRMAARAVAVDVLYDPDGKIGPEKLSKDVESVISVIEALDPVFKALPANEKSTFQEQVVRQVQDGTLDVATAKKMAERVANGENPHDVLLGKVPESVSAISLIDEVSGSKTPVESIPPPPPAKGEKLQLKALLGFTTDREVTDKTKSAISNWIANDPAAPKTQAELDALLVDLQKGAKMEADGKILVISDGHVHVETVAKVKERLGFAMKTFDAMAKEGHPLAEAPKRALLERVIRQAGKSEADIDADLRYAVDNGNKLLTEIAPGLPKAVSNDLAIRYLRGDVSLYAARQSAKQYQALAVRFEALGVSKEEFDQTIRTRVLDWYPDAQQNPSAAVEKSFASMEPVLDTLQPLFEGLDPKAKKAAAMEILQGNKVDLTLAYERVVDSALGPALDALPAKEAEAQVHQFLKTVLGNRYTPATEATYNNYFKAYGAKQVMANALSAMAFDYHIPTSEMIRLGQSLEGLDSKAQIALLANLMAQVKSIDGNATTDSDPKTQSVRRLAVGALVADTIQVAKQMHDLDGPGQAKLIQELAQGKYTLQGAMLQADRIATDARLGVKFSDPDQTHPSGSKLGPKPTLDEDGDKSVAASPLAKRKAAQNAPVKAENEEGTNPGTPAAKLKNKPTEVAGDEEVTKVAKVIPFPQQGPADPNVEASKAIADPGTSGVHKVLEGAGQDKAKVEKALEPFEAVAKAIEPNSKELAEGLRKDIETLKKGDTQSPEYKEALRRTVALQTILRAEGTAHLDAQQLAHAVKHAQEGPKVDLHEERTTILPPGGSTALGVLIGAAALISPELAHAAEGAAKDISSRGGVGTTEAAVIVGIGLLLAGPAVLKKYFKKGPPPEPPVTKANPIKLQSETKSGMIYPYTKADWKNAEVAVPGQFNLNDSMVIGDQVYLALDIVMPGEKTTQSVLPMSFAEAKRLGAEFDKLGNLKKVPAGDFIYWEGRPKGTSDDLAQAAKGMDVPLAPPDTPVALKDANGSVSQVRPLSVTDSGKEIGATVSYGKAVEVQVGKGENDPVKVKVEVYDPADPESDPKVLAFGLSKPKVLEARTFEMSRAEAIQLGILRVDKAGGPPVLADNAVLALNDEAANLHRNNRVFIPTSNEGGFTFYPAKAMGTKERIVGDIVRVDPEKTSRQGDTVYVWMRTPDLNSAGKDKLYSAEPVPMSLAEARKLGIYVSHDGKLKVVSNEFVMTPVTKEGNQVLVGGKPITGEINEGDVSVMFRLHDGKIEMSEKEKPQAPKAEILPPPSVSDVRGKKIPDALKVLGPLGVGLFAMAPDTAHAATQLSDAAATGGWMAAAGLGLSMLVGMAWWSGGGKGGGEGPNHPPMVPRDGITRFEFSIGLDGRPTIIPSLGNQVAMTFQCDANGQWFAHEGNPPEYGSQTPANWKPIKNGDLVKIFNPHTGEAYVIPFQAPADAWIPGYAPSVAGQTPQPPVSGPLPTGKLTAITPYIDDRPFTIGQNGGDLRYSDKAVAEPHLTIQRDLQTGKYYLINGSRGDGSNNEILVNGMPMGKWMEISDKELFAIRGADGKLAYFQFSDPKVPAGRVSAAGYVVLEGQSYHVKKYQNEVMFGTGALYGMVTYGSPVPGDPAGSISLAVHAGPNLDPNSPHYRTRSITVTAQQAKELGVVIGKDGRPLKPAMIKLTPGVEPQVLPQAAGVNVAVPLTPPPPPPDAKTTLKAVPAPSYIEAKFNNQSFKLEPTALNQGLPPGAELGQVSRLTPHPNPGVFVAEITYGNPSEAQKKMVVNLTATELKALGLKFDAQGRPIASNAFVKVWPGQAAPPISFIPDGKVDSVAQDNAPGAPRRGEVNLKTPTEFYGTASGKTHEGIGYKAVNEDAVIQGPNWAVVLDGMGGHGHGDKASTIAGEAITKYLNDHRNDPDPVQVLKDAFVYAGEAINATTYGKSGAGAVGVAHMVIKNPDGTYKAIIVHVGDAGAVVVGKDGKIKHRTKDQSLVQMLQDKGMKPNPADPHEAELERRLDDQANVVAGTLGAKQKASPTVTEIPLEPGDRILMFSDGVSDGMATKDLAKMAADSKTAEEAQQKIFDATTEKMTDREDAMNEFRSKRVAVQLQSGNTGYMNVYGKIFADEAGTQAMKGEEPTPASKAQALAILKPEKRLPVNTFDGKDAWIDLKGDIYLEPKGGKAIDHYKPDNMTIHVYFHNPADGKSGPPPKSDPSSSGPKLRVVPPPPAVVSPAPAGANPQMTAFPGVKADATEMASLAKLPMREVPKALLRHPNFRPTNKVEVDGQTFYLSSPIVSRGTKGDRTYILALVPMQENGQTVLKRRFFYKSESDGGWRACPYKLMGHLSKGEGLHYTQETQPVEKLNDAFLAMENNPKEFPPVRTFSKELNPFIEVGSDLMGEDNQAAMTMLKGFQLETQGAQVVGMTAVGKVQPGKLGYDSAYSDQGPTGAQILNTMENLKYPEGFIPNFAAEPAKTWSEKHSLLGPITCRQYGGSYLVDKASGQKRPVVWTMAEDGNGRVWIESIRFADSKINSYGVQEEVINSGILTSKPLDYYQQVAKINRPGFAQPFNENYSDITPALSLLKPIRDYRQARGLKEPGLKAPDAAPIQANPVQLAPEDVKPYVPPPPGPLKPAPIIRINSNTPGVTRVNGEWNVNISQNGTFPFSYEIGRLTFNDGADHAAISGQHLRIFRSNPNGPIWIQDLGSTNGTVVMRDGQPVYQAKNPKQPGALIVLRPGDEILIGTVKLKVT